MKSEDTLEYLNQTRTRLYQTLEDLSNEIICSVPVEGSWTIKDILGHISAWEITIIKSLESLASGGEFSPDIISDVEPFNLAQVNQRRTFSLDQVKSELQEGRDAILKVAERLSDKAWNAIYPAPWGGQDTLTNLIAGLADHEAEHTKIISGWREGNS